eukprot:11395294-Karenia_brevis.AAC.1
MDQEWQDILIAVAKMSLSTEQSCRLFRSVLVQCWKVPTESALVSQVGKNIKEFNSAARSLKEAGESAEKVKTQLGVPAAHAYNGILQAIIDMDLSQKGASAVTAQSLLKETIAVWRTQELGVEFIMDH